MLTHIFIDGHLSYFQFFFFQFLAFRNKAVENVLNLSSGEHMYSFLFFGGIGE